MGVLAAVSLTPEREAMLRHYAAENPRGMLADAVREVDRLRHELEINSIALEERQERADRAERAIREALACLPYAADGAVEILRAALETK